MQFLLEKGIHTSISWTKAGEKDCGGSTCVILTCQYFITMFPVFKCMTPLVVVCQSVMKIHSAQWTLFWECQEWTDGHFQIIPGRTGAWLPAWLVFVFGKLHHDNNNPFIVLVNLATEKKMPKKKIVAHSVKILSIGDSLPNHKYFSFTYMSPLPAFS